MVRIFLTGYMGAGKTTLGKAFARKMNVPFVDLDWYIEERFHKTVGELFTERGETGFRELERNMLHEVAEFENVVISTGGGAPCFFDNMEFMNRVGKTVFLDVHPDVLFRRLRIAKQQRPILQGKEDDELKAFIIRALEQRAPFYTQAQYIFNADELEDRWQIETAVQRLQELLGLLLSQVMSTTWFLPFLFICSLSFWVLFFVHSVNICTLALVTRFFY